MNSDTPENGRISPTGGSSLLVASSAPAIARVTESTLVPAPIALLGDDACHAWVEFFASHIRNPNTRASYARAAHALFRWLGDRGIEDIRDIRGVHISAWIEDRLLSGMAKATVKLELAAVRQLFAWLALHRIIPESPAVAVRGPKHVVRTGLTPVLTTAEARRFMRWLPSGTITELRDRAFIATLTYSFARVSAAVAMNLGDVAVRDGRWHVRLHEKAGKVLDIPCHHRLERYLRDYLAAGGLMERELRATPLFRAVDRRKGSVSLSGRRWSRHRAREAVERRAIRAGDEGVISSGYIGCHSLRATGITAYLEHPDARVEVAQYLAGHARTETTRLYDRREEQVSLDEVERIGI